MAAARPGVIANPFGMPTVASTPRALVISADPLVRAGLRGLLTAGGWDVAGEVESLARAHSAWLELPFEAALWDAVQRPTPEGGWSGLPPVVALVRDEASARAHLAAGLNGAVLRGAEAATVCAALQAACHGLTVWEKGFQTLRPASGPRAGVRGDVTKREREVLALLSQGLSNRAIAECLGISRHTVKFHVNALLQKLGVARRTEAVVRAAREGLIVL
jgi:two-component system, NarL family, nitrate/nitrite response regulator NarL